MFFVRALRDARGASKKNLLFRAAKHSFISPISLFGTKKWDAGCSVGWFVCSSFVCKRVLVSNERTANIFFLGKNLMFLFLVSEKGTEKADLGAAAPKYPAASRANADAPRRLIRTRLSESRNFAFAASKRTAKIEKLTRGGIEMENEYYRGGRVVCLLILRLQKLQIQGDFSSKHIDTCMARVV